MKKVWMAAMIAALLSAPAALAEDRVGDPYLLKTCPVSGQPLDSKGEPVVNLYNGREVRFCCAGCPPKFEADKAKFMAKIDEETAKLQMDVYPLTTCPVSGKDISAGSQDRVINNRLMKFCCNNCPKAAEADPAKFIAKLDEAVIAKQGPAYKATKCPISGEDLGSMGDPISKVVGNHLVKLCCKGCEKKFEANPMAAVEKIGH